jgi:cyclase
MGELKHLIDMAQHGKADAIAVADALHFNRTTVEALRAGALAAGLPVRAI